MSTAASIASAVLRLSSDGGRVHSTHRTDLEARGQALPRVVRTRPKLAILAERIRRCAAHLIAQHSIARQCSLGRQAWLGLAWRGRVTPVVRSAAIGMICVGTEQCRRLLARLVY